MRKIWLVQAQLSGLTMYLDKNENMFTFNINNARRFESEALAVEEFDGSPHFGKTPEAFSNIKAPSLLRSRYPEHEFRAISIEASEDDYVFSS